MPTHFSYRRIIKNFRFNYRLIARLLGMLLVILALSMALPLAVSVYYSDGAQFGLLLSGLLILALGLFLRNFVGYDADFELHERESLWYTLLIWIVVPLMGALPYVFTSSVHSFTDAAFESFSGFSTTGSSVFVDLENVPKGILVWRSTSQWVGGLGLILFIIAILRKLNEGAAKLYESEFSGTLQQRLHPRMTRNVGLMWWVYTLLTISLFILLLAGGNGFVDSLCLALSTVSTGGFMPHSEGLAHASTYTVSIISLFMFLSGINIAILFYFITGKFRQAIRDEEFKIYLFLYLTALVLCTTSFAISRVPIGKSVQFSLFHVASTLSTCGFYTQPPTTWPVVVSIVTLILLFMGASAGSTGGGIKLKRLMILRRQMHNYFMQMIHPRAVFCVKINGMVVEESYIGRVFAFLFLYLLFVVMGAFVLTICGLDIPNAFCMSAANMSNLGPSPIINTLGAATDYLTLPVAGKWTLIVLMIAGRLEIFALVAVTVKAYWRRR